MDLDFADYIALLTESRESMQSKITTLAMVSAKTGLKINICKTKVMRAGTGNEERIELDEAAIDEVEDFTYLGGNISRNGGADQDIYWRGSGRQELHL